MRSAGQPTTPAREKRAVWGPRRGRLSLCELGCPWASVMPKKRKKKMFSAAKVVREMARERVGSPRPSSFVPGKKKKAEKHKPTLGKLMEDQ